MYLFELLLFLSGTPAPEHCAGRPRVGAAVPRHELLSALPISYALDQ